MALITGKLGLRLAKTSKFLIRLISGKHKRNSWHKLRLTRILLKPPQIWVWAMPHRVRDRRRWSPKHSRALKSFLILRRKTNPFRILKGIRRLTRRLSNDSNISITLIKLSKSRSKTSMKPPRKRSLDTWSPPRRETEKCTNPLWSFKSRWLALKREIRVQVRADTTAQMPRARAMSSQAGAKSRRIRPHRVAKIRAQECHLEAKRKTILGSMSTTFIILLPCNIHLNQYWSWPKQCALFSRLIL